VRWKGCQDLSPEQTDLYGNAPSDKGDLIADMRTGMTVEGLFAVIQASTRPTKSGQPFLTLELRDRTGHIRAVGWEHAHLIEQLDTGSVIWLEGTVDEYQGDPQIRVVDLRVETGEVPPEFFVAEGPQDREALMARLKGVRAKVSTPYLKELLDRIFDDPDLLDAYLLAPAAKLRHQAYVGGLAEHSLNMAEHALHCADFYPELNRDLLVTGALLHDIGKIEEYRIDTVIEFSDVGRMEGHIVLGDRFVRRLSDQIEGFPEEMRMQLSHLILSHQGRLEYASPVTPKSMEAVVLYVLDLLDSRVATYRDIRDRYAGQNRRWSDYDRLDERFWFLGEGTPSGP
jgi:3'-5' exoribonuclease